jgi:hypothetical protein
MRRLKKFSLAIAGNARCEERNPSDGFGLVEMLQ